MSRTLTLTVHEIIQAGSRLRELKALPAAPGVPAPPFNATLKAGTALRTLFPFLQEYVTQEAALRNEFALRNTDGTVVIKKDPNGNIEDGAFYTKDAPVLAERLNALRMEPKTVTLGDLSLDDVVDVSRGNLDVAAVNDLLPILDPQTLSDAGQQRLLAYQTAAAVAPPT
jgi:hypothetical protein